MLRFSTKMIKNSEFQELNVDDKLLIAQKANKTKSLVDKVLRGDRKNKVIITLAYELIAKKAEFKNEFLNESITEAIETVSL